MLFSGCGTQTEIAEPDAITETGDSAQVRQARVRAAEGGSSSRYAFTGTPRVVVAPEEGGIVQSTGTDTIYEDHLVRLEKVYKSGSTVGAPFNYDIIVTAKRALTNVEVDEILPDSIKFQESNPKAAMNQFGQPTWALQSFKANEQQTINVTVVPSKVGSHEVCSIVRAEPLICLPLYVGKPELRITKTGPARVELGENVTWDIGVTNVGNAIADNVTIKDTLPEGFSAVGPTERNVGSMQPGASTNFQVTGKSNKVGSYTNTAVAQFTGGEPVSATAPVEIVQSAVAITKTGPEQGYIFVDVPYKITVTNKGNTTLNNLVVTDFLPDGAVIKGRVDQGGEVFDVTEGRRVFLGPQHHAERGVHGYWLPGNNPLTDDTADEIVWKIDSLAAGASRTYTVNFHANKPMTTVNKATVVAGGLTESASATTVWRAVPGVHTSIIDSVDPIQVGQDTTFTIKTLNQSGFETFTVTSQVVNVAEGLTIKSVSSGGTVNGQEVTFIPATLGPGREITRTITVTGATAGNKNTTVTTMTNFLTQPVIDNESTTVY